MDNQRFKRVIPFRCLSECQREPELCCKAGDPVAIVPHFEAEAEAVSKPEGRASAEVDEIGRAAAKGQPVSAGDKRNDAVRTILVHKMIGRINR